MARESQHNGRTCTRAGSSRSGLSYFGELTNAAPQAWLIKNVIARGENSSWIAPPGNGKSALLTDIGVHWRAALIGAVIATRAGAEFFTSPSNAPT